MNYMITTIEQLEAVFNARENLKNFHYFTNDEDIYDHFCHLVAKTYHLEDDPKTASNITDQELKYLNEKFHLDLRSAYLNGPQCNCGRQLNGFDFILNAVFQHGVSMLKSPKFGDEAKFIMPFRRAMNSVCCSNCGEHVELRKRSWYRDSSSIDSYGPCCS